LHEGIAPVCQPTLTPIDPERTTGLTPLVLSNMQDSNGESGQRSAQVQPEPAVRDRRYQVLRELARGGLGVGVVALDSELNREGALKEIQPGHADDVKCRERFVLEAEITGRLEHPGIVPIYGLGSDVQGRPYYAMRLIKGVSLKDAIEEFHLV